MTGLNVYVSATIAFVVCTFYTTIVKNHTFYFYSTLVISGHDFTYPPKGGLKAVVWTDTVQIVLMIGSMATLVIKGVIDVGIENVWRRNLNSSRLEFFKYEFEMQFLCSCNLILILRLFQHRSRSYYTENGII